MHAPHLLVTRSLRVRANPAAHEQTRRRRRRERDQRPHLRLRGGPVGPERPRPRGSAEARRRLPLDTPRGLRLLVRARRAHLLYNSYVGFTGLVEECGLRGDVLPRAKTHLRFLDGDRIVPGSNLGVLLRLFSWPEAAVHLPRMLGAKKEGKTVEEFYGRIVGKGNYAKVLGPMLSAVPSQSADGLPGGDALQGTRHAPEGTSRAASRSRAGSRRLEALAKRSGVTVATGKGAASIEARGDGWSVVAEDGERHEAGVVAVATPPSAAAAVLGSVAPDLAAQAGRVKEAVVETLGVAVRAAKVSRIPVSMFLVPKKGRLPLDRHPRLGARRRVALVLVPLPPRALPGAEDRAGGAGPRPRPSGPRGARPEADGPAVARAGARGDRGGDRPPLVRQEALRPRELVAGLSIEDCVDRSLSEWKRVESLG